MNVAVAAQEEERGLHPYGTTAVRHQDFQFREVDSNVIQINRVAKFVARVGEDRGPGMDHYRNSVRLRGPIQYGQFLYAIHVIVGEQ